MNGSGQGADALVIGGGVIGLSTAVALCEAGYSVRLLERGRTGRQASWAGGGILSPLYPWREAPVVQDLARESMALYPALAERLRAEAGIDPEWTQSGLVSLGLDAGERLQAIAWARRSGICLDADRRWRGREALYFPEVAQIRNPRLCAALSVLLVRLGGVIQEGCEVLSIEPGQGLHRVRSTCGEHHAERVVLCAGSWTAALARSCDWELPIRPVKGQMILLRGGVRQLETILLEEGHYLIPRRDGRILVGSTVEPAGFDDSVVPAVRERLHDFAARQLPAAREMEVEAHWAGLRPAAPDGIPIIARHPRYPGIYVNAGQYRNGLTLAPASARRLLGLLQAA